MVYVCVYDHVYAFIWFAREKNGLYWLILNTMAIEYVLKIMMKVYS